MNIILTFAIICSLGVPVILGRPNSKDKDIKLKQLLRECARELNVDKETSFDEKTRFIEDKEARCVIGCAMRKSAVEELIGSNNKETAYNGISKITNEAYKAGFKSSDFTRKHVIDEVEDCYDAARTECDFFKCVFRIGSQFQEVFGYFNSHHLRDTVINLN